MENLAKQALLGTVKFQIALAAMIFGPALTLNYWQGWLFWLVFFGCVLATTIYFPRSGAGSAPHASGPYGGKGEKPKADPIVGRNFRLRDSCAIGA